MKPTRIRAAVVSAVMAAMLTAAGEGTAQALPPADHNCVFEGENLNTLLGVSERLLGPPSLPRDVRG